MLLLLIFGNQVPAITGTAATRQDDQRVVANGVVGIPPEVITLTFPITPVIALTIPIGAVA